MYETPEDVSRLQELLDESHASMGQHMRSILTPEKRLTATDLIEQLQGMRLLSLATVNTNGEPRVGPVDGHFYRGTFWFGSAPNSVRFQHIRAAGRQCHASRWGALCHHGTRRSTAR